MNSIPLFAVHMPYAVKEPLMKVLFENADGMNPMIGQGPKVEAFEKALAARLGWGNVLTLNSGTAGLSLALRLAGVGSANVDRGGNSQNEVLCPAITCSASATPILAAGAIPVWVDVDPLTGLVDPLDVERKITKNTKAIICVHWGGTPCNLDALNNIAERYGLYLIEDGAHAFGATYNGRQVGAGTSDFTMFSFQAIKHINTIDGGLLTVRDSDLFHKGKLIRWYGIDRESERKDMRCEEDIPEWGMKWHMNDVAATIGLVQLDYIDGILKAHRDNARRYFNEINNPLLEPCITGEQLGESAFWLYTVQCENQDEFIQYMRKKGIPTSRVHSRLDTHTTFLPYQRNPLPGTDYFTSRMVCIPVHHKLDVEQVNWVIECCNQFAKEEVLAWS